MAKDATRALVLEWATAIENSISKIDAEMKHIHELRTITGYYELQEVLQRMKKFVRQTVMP